MNIKEIKKLIECLESIKTTKFYCPNDTVITLMTSFKSVTGICGIRTTPLDAYQKVLAQDLNEAIKPVLEKYVKIYEDEIKKQIQ